MGNRNGREKMGEQGTGPHPANGAIASRDTRQGRSSRLERGARAVPLGLAIVLLAYLVLGTLYATATPAWQVPDEPAHYNYVKYVAEHEQLPELEPGDFPAEYLEQIKSQRFPPSLSIDPIRYESHQPPLYYVLGAIVYRLGQGVLGTEASDRQLAILLRVLSLLIGGVTLVVGYRIVRRVYPEEPGLALGTVAFMAFLPMHLAMNAGVNNDSLAELMLALAVWRLVEMGDGRSGGRWPWRSTLRLGALLGIALLTKMQSYVAVGIALFALGWDTVDTRRSEAGGTWTGALARATAMLGIALLVVSPWLVRNMFLYGPNDPLGMVRHDQVAAGQLSTQQFVQQYGAGKLLRDLLVTTFHSFWGQFGWMGVPMPQRVYAVLGVLSALAGAGLVGYAGSLRGQSDGLVEEKERARQNALARGARPACGSNWRGMALLAAWVLATTLVFLWYNTKYVQHQGRYLFPALVPWGLAFTLGLCTALRRLVRATLLVLGAALLVLVAYGAWRGDFQEFYVGLVVSTAAAIGLGHGLEKRYPGAALALVYAGLCALALIGLYAYIVPNLQPPPV